jgi:hypothetical protein
MSLRDTSLSATQNHIDCLKYLHENGCPWHPDTTNVAAENGNLDCLIYAHENGCPWHIDTVNSAAMAGHIDCALYASKNDAYYDNTISKYIEDKFGITLRAHMYQKEIDLLNERDRHSALDQNYRNLQKRFSILKDNFINLIVNDIATTKKLNIRVDIHIDQADQTETTSRNEHENFLFLG